MADIDTEVVDTIEIEGVLYVPDVISNEELEIVLIDPESNSRPKTQHFR